MYIPRSLLIAMVAIALLLLIEAELLNQSSNTVFELFIIGCLVVLIITWVSQKKHNGSPSAETRFQQNNYSDMAKELENLRHRHRQILLDLPLGVFALNDKDEITLWNRTLEKITGISNGEVSGTRLTELNEPWLTLLYNFLTGEYTHLYKQSFELSGKKRTVNLHKSVIEESAEFDQYQGGILILLEDISETEMLEAGLTHSERLASIGRLAAGVAHEIGNPITGIACLAQNIRDEYQDEELRTMSKQIIEQTDRTSRIVQSLVNFAHAGTTSSRSESEIISIRDCIDEAITLVSLDKKGKSFSYVVECDPDIKMMGDSQRFLQVLLNLINNARDASQPESAITLRCEAGSDEVRITVEDQGVGIPPAIRDRVFDPFFTTKEAGDGTGLGLSLVFNIVEDLHGNIDIISPTKSRPNSGTRVILRFPRFEVKHIPGQITDGNTDGASPAESQTSD